MLPFTPVNICIVLTVAKFVGNDENNRTDFKLSIYIYYNNIHYQLNCFRGIGQESRSVCLKILYIFLNHSNLVILNKYANKQVIY